MRDFRKLDVWEKSHQLTLAVYRITRDFPKEELYGLTSQMRRACVSIPANIAEGSGRESLAERVRFLQISMGSASEVQYYFLLTRDLGWLPSETCEKLTAEVEEIKRMLTGLMKKLKPTT